MVAPMAIGAIVGAGYGLLNHQQKMKDAQRQRQLAATLESTSYWTHMHPQTPGADPSLLSDVGEGALTGASFGTNLVGKKKGGNSEMAGGSDDSLALTDESPQGNMVEQDAQNPPPTVEGEYGYPGAQGYSPWTSMFGVGAKMPYQGGPIRSPEPDQAGLVGGGKRESASHSRSKTANLALSSSPWLKQKLRQDYLNEV